MTSLYQIWAINDDNAQKRDLATVFKIHQALNQKTSPRMRSSFYLLQQSSWQTVRLFQHKPVSFPIACWQCSSKPCELNHFDINKNRPLSFPRLPDRALF